MTLQKFQKLYNETHDICQDLHKKSNYIAIMRFVLALRNVLFFDYLIFLCALYY